MKGLHSMMFRKVALISVLIALLVAGVGVAGAQDGDPGPFDGPRGRGLTGDRLFGELIELVTETTGLTPREVLSEIRDGATLAEVIEANGEDVSTFTTEAVALLTEQINEAVETGRITQERADMALANLEAHVTAALDGELSDGLRSRFNERRPRPDGGPGMADPLLRGLINLVAEQTGLMPQEVVEQLRAGVEPATILTENGVEVDAFIETAIAEAEARYEQITQERLERLRDRLEELLNTGS
jgi:urease gamma subunit